MRVALYQGKKNIELTNRQDYECGDNGIILKNVYSSICGTDVAVYQHGLGMGHRVTVVGEFGHETVCTVSAVGKNVTDIRVGDRVYPYPRLVTGDPKRAGTIGIAAAISLKYFGCKQVVVCDPSEFRLSICRKLGFETVCNGSQDAVKEFESILGTGMGIRGNAIDSDIWIDAAGADRILTDYEQFGKYNSRMVMVAVGTNTRKVDILGLTFGQKSLAGSGGYTPEDVLDVMEIMKSGNWDIEKIITHEYAWEQLTEALETASDPQKALNVIIHFEK